MFLKKKISERIDWLGVVLIIAAFAFNSFGVIQATSFVYIGLNVIGSGCIAGISYLKRDLQPMMLNMIWMLVAITSLVRALIH